jgi:hypothetical protein
MLGLGTTGLTVVLFTSYSGGTVFTGAVYAGTGYIAANEIIDEYIS